MAYIISSGESSNDIILESFSMIVFNSGTANNTTIKSDCSLFVYNGGIANKTTVNHLGELHVSSGGIVNDTTLNAGELYVSNGGIASNTIVNRFGDFRVYSGGKVTNTTINRDGYFVVENGATALDIDWTPCIGHLKIAAGAIVTFTNQYTGVYSGGSNQPLSSAVLLESQTLSSDNICAMSGGVVNDTMVKSDGCLFIYNGGKANNTVVSSNGDLYIYGGTANTTIINNQGGLHVYGDGTVTETTINGGGWFSVESGGTAISTINKGNMFIHSGGKAIDTTVSNGGQLYVRSGGTAINTTISEGEILVSSGGKLTGQMSFDHMATVYAPNGAFFDFDLTRTSVGAAALVNNLSCVNGALIYTLTVDGTPASGTYRLADGVSSFDSEVFIMNISGEQLGTLVVGQKLETDFTDYTLNVLDGSLIITVNPADIVPPDQPVATADITTLTNGDVFVTATFNEDSTTKQYSLDGKTWILYTESIKFTENGTVSFRGTDEAGNVSEITSYEVSNIDKIAPVRPEVFADVTTPTNGDVTVSAKFSEDSVKMEYSLDGGETWENYKEGGVIIIINSTVNFRSIDEAGNVSEATSYVVSNIDKVAPGNPSGLLSVVSNQTVALLWNICTDDFSGVKEYVVTYLLDGQEFTARTANTNYVLNNANVGTYSWSVQAVDFAGNESAIVAGDAFTISGFKPYTVEYSADNFEHVIRFTVSSPTLDSFRMPTGTYQLHVRQEGSNEWMTGDSIVAAEFDSTPQLIKSDADGNADVFFANPVGTWESCYLAQHVGSINDWTGTNEFATLYGKNKLADIIEGSTDANILLMTDDDNGDTLFVDDIYTASPGNMAEQQARIAQIDEIRAGAGNDIVDMTSQQFEYIGDGLTIRGGEGNDTIWANKGNNWLFGDAGNDRIVGASGEDVIVGGIGNDRMHGGGGSDIFTFCDNWGLDNVEQLATGSVTLWFAEGSKDNWDEATLTYTDGDSSVKVSGVTSDKVTLKFGDDGSAQFASLTSMGAFFDATTERIFEESGKGILANL